MKALVLLLQVTDKTVNMAHPSMDHRCTLIKFSYDIKLGGPVDTLKGRAAIQTDLDGLEEWANGNLMQFNRDKCGVPCLGRKTPGSNTGLSAEQDPGLVSESKPNRSQQHTQAAQGATSTLGCINRSPAN